ncbi:MAG: phosphonate ABC transporter ATP-binding protein [Eubacteriales bacterium]|nr:phosphonate ABC transporter ATP-binding protein [Eubacteriales bacterium]
MELLEIRDVSKIYNRQTVALSNISLNVGEGEFVSIIGPSGAGKSTLLRCINRMIDPSSGAVFFQQNRIDQLPKKKLRQVRTQIGMVFQHYNLVNRLTVFENVLHGRLGYKSTLAGVLGYYDSFERRAAYEILAALGLQEQVFKRCDQLSGGQKQRVGIARALLQRPKMLLCDEPIASLDPSSSKIIMDHLQRISREMKITCLVNLHQVDVAIKYSDRIIGIRNGEVVFDGPPAQITPLIIEQIYGTEAHELILSLETLQPGQKSPVKQSEVAHAAC